MDKFYKIGIIIAVVLLIIGLVIMGILLQFQNAGTKFPLHPNTCPDLWDSSANGLSCVNATSDNKGVYNKNDLVLSEIPNICDKYKWANVNGVNWDGVSNYNGC
jgi:hypothetical protein